MKRKIVGHPDLVRDESGFIHVKQNLTQVDLKRARAKVVREKSLEDQVARLTKIVESLTNEDDS